MSRSAIIVDTLETVAERIGDPKDQIYARLFAAHPHFEDLFVMDTDGGVRANMLAAVFDCILGVADGSESPRLHLEAARVQHDGYGLSAADVHTIFETVRDVCRDVLNEDWSAEMDAAWHAMLNELRTIGTDFGA